MSPPPEFTLWFCYANGWVFILIAVGRTGVNLSITAFSPPSAGAVVVLETLLVAVCKIQITHNQ